MFAFIKSKKIWSLSNDLAYGSLHDKVLFRAKKEVFMAKHSLPLPRKKDCNFRMEKIRT